MAAAGGVVEAILQRNHPVFILAPDFISNLLWVPDLFAHHVPGSITWAVSSCETEKMENYRGSTLVDNAIVGRTDKSIVRSFAMLVEPDVLRPFVTENKNENVEGEDLFYKVMPRLEQENLRRIREGKKSILNVYRIPGRVFDYGSPERLSYLSKHLDVVLQPELPKLHKPQFFYVYDTNMKPVDVRSRERVHIDGGWHRGVQLNIVCNDKILLQRRSGCVDIAKGQYDQTLATQMLVEDNHDERKALKRGMEEELGISGGIQFEKIAGPVRISKKYAYDHTLLNQEYVSLYEARVDHEFIPRSSSTKIGEFLWMPISVVKRLVSQSPDMFTKTFTMWLKEVM